VFVPDVLVSSGAASSLLASSGGLYDALVALHVVCAVVGFGAVAISGVYGGLSRNPENSVETRRYFASRGLAEWLILPVPFFGVGAFLADDRSGDLAEAWVIAGSAVWVLATVLLVAVVRPAERRIRIGGDTVTAGRTLMLAGLACDVLFVVALAVMVTQPG
jgi:uncharacterized membrane protein